MKILIVLCALSLVVLASASPLTDGCIYIDGECHTPCAPGTYGYTSGCGRIKPEPTCEDPNPRPTGRKVCDYSACYCKPPTVRNKATDKCVPIEECPKKEVS